MSDTFTIDMNSPSIQYLSSKDKRLAKVIDMVGSIEYRLHDDNPYCFLVHEIIEQMLSIKAGTVIFERLSNLCKKNICPEVVSKLTDTDLKSIGTSKNKVACIRELTNAILSSNLSLNDLNTMDDNDVLHELTKIKGIGNWTAKMYLLFVLNRPDILPYEDVAFLQTYKWLYKTENTSKESVVRKCKKWKPYSSIASRYMYRSLDMGLTLETFHLYKTRRK